MADFADLLTASESAHLAAKLRADGCVCASVEVAVNRDTHEIVIAHERPCPLAPPVGVRSDRAML